METKEYHTKDKSAWGPGPWQDEPDKVQFPDAETGLPCLIKRNYSGALCGYVGVSEGHPYFGVQYDDVPVEVHGGLTYSDRCTSGTDEAHGICHLPGEGKPDHVWWLGFDCNHSGDASPMMTARYGRLSEWETYKAIPYVKSEIAKLAKQLAEI